MRCQVARWGTSTTLVHKTRHPLLGLRWRHAYTSQYVRQLSAVGGQGCKRCLLLPPQRLRVSRNPASRACGVRCVRCQVARWGTSTTLVYKTAILSSASAGGTPIHRSMSASCRRSEARVANAASSCRHSASESPGILQAERVAYRV